MEELLKDLANLLHMSTDSLLKIGESYPELRQQYIVYSITSDFTILAFFAAIASVISIIYANSIESNAKDLRAEKYDRAMTRSKNWMKIGMILAISTVSIYAISSIVAAVFAPDVNLIRDIVTRVKGV